MLSMEVCCLGDEVRVVEETTFDGNIVVLEIDTVTIEDVNSGLGDAVRVDPAEVAAVIAINNGNDVAGSEWTVSC